MANYKHILYNLKIFERLHNVTKSIKLVAFTKFKKIQHRVKLFNESLISVSKLAKVSDSIISGLRSYLVVPITSDKGCCGSINTHLLAAMEGLIFSFNKANKKISIALIGKKGKIFVKFNYKMYFVKYVEDVFNSALSMVSTVKIIEEIQKISYDKCVFLFNHFKNINEQKVYFYDALSFKLFVQNILFLKNATSADSPFWVSMCSKYMSVNNLLHDMYDFFTSIVLLRSLLDHEISELGGRITSMEKSSQNALEMYSSLQIQYNKARQSYITNQLIEICSASAAIGA
jgi:F-type H+-transporting ATPase subunit gamma